MSSRPAIPVATRFSGMQAPPKGAKRQTRVMIREVNRQVGSRWTKFFILSPQRRGAEDEESRVVTASTSKAGDALFENTAVIPADWASRSTAGPIVFVNITSGTRG